MLGGSSSSYLVQPVNDNIRYLLYNYDNLAYVTTLHAAPHISPVFMRTISDIAAVIKDKREFSLKMFEVMFEANVPLQLYVN